MIGLIIDGMAVRVSSPVLIGRVANSSGCGPPSSCAQRPEPRAPGRGRGGSRQDAARRRARGAGPADGCRSLVGGCLDVGEGRCHTDRWSRRLRGFVRACRARGARRHLGRPRRARSGATGAGTRSRGSRSRAEHRLGPGPAVRAAPRRPRTARRTTPVAARRRGPPLVGSIDARPARRSWSATCATRAVVIVLPTAPTSCTARHPLLPFLAELERRARSSASSSSHSTARSRRPSSRRSPVTRLDPALVESIFERSERQRVLRRGAPRRRRRVGRTELPPTLRDILLARIADLAEPTQEFLRVASAAGQRVDPALLAAAAGLDERRSTRRCASASRARSWSRIRRPASSATPSATRCSRRRSTTTCCPASGPAARGVRADARGQLGRRSTRSRAPPSSRTTGTRRTTCRGRSSRRSRQAARPRRGTRSRRRRQYERAIELWDQVPDAEARAGRDRIDCSRRSPTSPASTRPSAPWPTSRRRSASSTRPPTRCGAASSTSDSAGMRGSPARASSPSRPIGPPCA